MSSGKRSIPAGTGVWVVKTSWRRTCAHRLVERFAVGDAAVEQLEDQEPGVPLVEVEDTR